MLLQFTVENAFSFRDRAVLSMVAAPGVEHTDAQVIRVPGGPEVLRVAALYGANASGKSNLVKALGGARGLVARGVRPEAGIPSMYFKLTAKSRRAPSRFEFELLLEGKRWSYGLVLGQDVVEAEWLYIVDASGDEVRVFERSKDDDVAPGVVLGQVLVDTQDRSSFLRFVAEGTRPEQPFLSECIERNVVELEPVTGWFRDVLVVRAGDVLARNARDPALLEFISILLRDAGTGVQEVAVRRRALSDSGEELDLHFSPETDLASIQRSSPPTLVFKPLGGDEIYLERSEQSDGTLRLMDLAILLVLAQDRTQPRLMVVDELDRSLHTLLTRFFLQQFYTRAAGSNTQLIFTTHDTNLLDLDLLPRDSIWFVEKDNTGSSSLYSLAEFNGEQLDALTGQLERGYLQGRFGAIPFFGDPVRLGWRDKRPA